MNIFSLNKKTALIIGGAGKIGSYIAEGFLEADANVIIASKNKVNLQEKLKELKKISKKIDYITLDQSSEKSLQKCSNQIKKKFGTPDILVNSGVSRPMTKFFDDSFDSWDESMRINSRGLFLSTKIFGEEMVKNGGGSIINISSIYGLVAPDMKIYEGSDFETEPDYPYNKGGMNSYTKYLASFFAKGNVRVNVIAPGGVFNNQNLTFLEKYEKKVPLGRMAQKDDFKGLSIFLASDSSSFITGNIIPLDGGFTII